MGGLFLVKEGGGDREKKSKTRGETEDGLQLVLHCRRRNSYFGYISLFPGVRGRAA